MERFVVDRLRERLLDRVVTATDVDYDVIRATFNATVQRRPAVIVRARTDDDVIAAVVAAADLGLPIAVRGGGHGVAGHAMAEGALVVDLRDRREVTVDPASRTIRAAGGALWDDVDTAAWKHHLAVVGGTFGDTGVAGLTLGGGIGWLSGLQGFTCDNLIRAEVITAAGEKVVAGPDGDPDLLWALRGGGGNFGVVTSFEFRAIDPGPILAGYITYPASAVKQVLRHLAELAAEAPDALELTVAIGPHGADPDAEITVRVGVAWPGQASTEPDVLRRLRTALPVIDDGLSLMEYPDLQAMSGRLPFGLRHYWKGHFLRGLDESVIGGVVESMARPAARHQHHPDGGDPRRGPHRARGRRRIRSAGRDLERERARDLGRRRDRSGAPGLGPRVGRPAVGRHAVRGRLRQLRPGRRVHRTCPARLRQRALRPTGVDQGALRPREPLPVQPERRPGLSRSEPPA